MHRITILKSRQAMHICLLFLSILITQKVTAQNSYELNTGWKCSPISQVKTGGNEISSPAFSTTGWLPAVVPGTILTTQLANKQIPDPFMGLNNETIPDLYHTGPAPYTYWFLKDFKETPPAKNGQVYLNLRGVNYACEIYLNGKKVNQKTNYGMFLRREYNITALLARNGANRLAILVSPAEQAGNPNGGQGGDGTIARNVGMQYTAGWDWIQPVRDRNTGIWDKVSIIKTGAVHILNPHIITLVPGTRQVNGPQKPATIKVTAELENATGTKQTGVVKYTLAGQTLSKRITLEAKSTKEIKLDDCILQNPKLWWPNGYGAQNLYDLKISFTAGDGSVSDGQTIKTGVREIQTSWNAVTNSRQIAVNGQKIFIKGGNWIISDAMLRFTDARYDAEVRFHKDMNLNLIRIWGGAMIERPEFFEACDKYGLLVFQDFWMSGDCNGKWTDPQKKDDQWTRRNYPDDHQLFLASAADQVKMVRNHPSLAMWCGGNEITPPEDILIPLRDSILNKLDGTRWFIEYSNSDEMSLNTLGGNGDGPYGIQTTNYFWEHRTYPFNSEVGSVGVSDYESLERFLPKENLVVPVNAAGKTDPVWEYHKYIGYDNALAPYGEPTDLADFCNKAQLVNYDQYRALAEGFTSRVWDWYSGFIIWKTQNPWTALRGQMYDYYLDPNACLYGLRNGAEPLHVMYSPLDGMVFLVNNGFETRRDMMLTASIYDMDGKEYPVTKVFEQVMPSRATKVLSVKNKLDEVAYDKGAFLSLKLLDRDKKTLSENLYWVPDHNGKYSGLKKMKQSPLKITARFLTKGKIEVELYNDEGAPVSFFNRLSLIDAKTKKRVLPVFYSDNYSSVLPGQRKKIIIDYAVELPALPQVSVSGWNGTEKLLDIAPVNNK